MECTKDTNGTRRGDGIGTRVSEWGSDEWGNAGDVAIEYTSTMDSVNAVFTTRGVGYNQNGSTKPIPPLDWV